MYVFRVFDLAERWSGKYLD